MFTMPARTLLGALAFCTVSTVFAAGQPKVTERPPFSAFEFDVRHKEHIDTDPAIVYAAVWSKTLETCDDAAGYLTEYHDGFKRSHFDTREGAVRMNAYATCEFQNGPDEFSVTTPAPVDARLVVGSGLPPSTGLVVATGDRRAAYEAVREKVYQTCLTDARRLRFMSLSHTPNRQSGYTVEGRFACNSAMDASPQSD